MKKGKGLLKVDFSEHAIDESSLLAFAPYQPSMISTNELIEGIALQFHSDFYCIHRNPKETDCDQVLFNTIYDTPFFEMDITSEETLNRIINQLREEISENGNSESELLIPHLKIFLVNASRMKESTLSKPKISTSETPFILQSLKTQIETNFKKKHALSEYARLLNISPNALAKIVKTHYNKTLTNLISERIMIEAKRELYMTNKSVKEIAWHLGYQDEHYFSRMFKTNTDISPQTYRDTVGFGKAELN